MDYTYKKSGTIFNAHSYWTKQPVDVIAEFIKRNTKQGDIVLDPFCGTGMTGVAAIMTNRRYRMSDLSPICAHISRGYCTKLESFDIHNIVETIVDGIENDYYLTNCPKCGSECSVDYFILDDELEKNNDTPIDKVVFHCMKCKRKISKNPDERDLENHNCKDYENYYYPKAYFFGQEPQRNYKKGIKQVYQLYSKRNLSALSRLRSNIEKIEDDNIKSICLFAFTAIVFNCSLMSRYNPKYENTQIRMGTFYIPWKIKDNNVIQSYKRKLNGILKSNRLIFSDNKIYDGSISVSSATNLSYLGDESIDYIYTDPPYSDKISYSELNIVYESWLGREYTNTADEMIVSKNHKKDISEYSRMFSAFLNEAYRVLKDQSNITIIFHNSNIEHWKYFQDIIANSGFRPIRTKMPDRIISNSKTSTQYQSSNISRCFLAFTLKKADTATRMNLRTLEKNEYEKIVSKLREEAIKNGYTSRADQYDYLINSLIYDYAFRNDVSLL